MMMTKEENVSEKTRTEWFEHDRFGMFVHFGLYSLPAGIWKGKRIQHAYSEWLQASERIPRAEYRQLAQQFNPTGFDADAWMQVVRAAGMKYFLITAKHHDGFALWPSKASEYNVMEATPFKRDILGELAVAAKRHGVKLGFYYSHWLDWEGTGGDICTVHMENAEYVHPTQAQFETYWQNKCLAQVRELIENYDPAFFWFDSWHDYQGKGRDFTGAYLTIARQNELIALIRRLNDRCLVNSRINFTAPSNQVDYMSTMDNEFPDQGFAKPWETSGTLNDSWGYHCLDFGWKSTRSLIQNLVGNASLGGNYQLNVGPTGDGEFQPAAIRRLHEIGEWLRVNGESIYGTQASPVGKMPWGRITSRRSDNGATRLFLHLWDFTPGTALQVTGMRNEPVQAIVLETGQNVKAEVGMQGVWIELPKELAGLTLPVIALDVKGEVNP
jgi:alpha-L-fucosidase